MSKEEDDDDDDKPLHKQERMRVVSLDRVAKFLGISKTTLRRHHSDKFIHISPRKVGMRVRDALAIGEKTA